MNVTIVRRCARCGEVEHARRQLVTVAELLGIVAPIDFEDVGHDPIHTLPYCVARDCAGAAARSYVAARLKARHSGKGKRKAEPLSALYDRAVNLVHARTVAL